MPITIKYQPIGMAGFGAFASGKGQRAERRRSENLKYLQDMQRDAMRALHGRGVMGGRDAAQPPKLAGPRPAAVAAEGTLMPLPGIDRSAFPATLGGGVSGTSMRAGPMAMTPLGRLPRFEAEGPEGPTTMGIPSSADVSAFIQQARQAALGKIPEAVTMNEHAKGQWKKASDAILKMTGGDKSFNIGRPEVQEKVAEAYETLRDLQANTSMPTPAELANRNRGFLDTATGKIEPSPGPGRIAGTIDPKTYNFTPDAAPPTTPQRAQLEEEQKRLDKQHDREYSRLEKEYLQRQKEILGDQGNYDTPEERDAELAKQEDIFNMKVQALDSKYRTMRAQRTEDFEATQRPMELVGPGNVLPAPEQPEEVAESLELTPPENRTPQVIQQASDLYLQKLAEVRGRATEPWQEGIIKTLESYVHTYGPYEDEWPPFVLVNAHQIIARLGME